MSLNIIDTGLSEVAMSLNIIDTGLSEVVMPLNIIILDFLR